MALPLKKRAYRGNDYSTAKRLKRVERRINSYKPEMKSNEFFLPSTAVPSATMSPIHLTGITQGDLAYNRIGQKAKLWRMEIRGIVDPNLDVYLIQSKNGTAPVIGDFRAGVGGFILDGKTNLVEWRYLRARPDQTADVPFRITQTFKTGYNLEFKDGLSTLERNPFYLVVRNNTAASGNYSFSLKLWYTDV